MCNFVLRPIKSYSTVDVSVAEVNNETNTFWLERGSTFQVTNTSAGRVIGIVDGQYPNVSVDIETFVHSFTANPDDVEKCRKEEYKTMGYDPKAKKEAK